MFWPWFDRGFVALWRATMPPVKFLQPTSFQPADWMMRAKVS